MIKFDTDKFMKIPISELTEPKRGSVCHKDVWWPVEDECIFIYKSNMAPQCNKIKGLLERFYSSYEHRKMTLYIGNLR